MKFTSVAEQEKIYVKNVIERITFSRMHKKCVVTRLFFLADHNIQYTNIRTILSSVLSLVFFAQNGSLNNDSTANCDLFLCRKKQEREEVSQYITEFISKCRFTLEPLFRIEFCEVEFSYMVTEFEKIFYHDFFDGMFTDEAVGKARELKKEIEERARNITSPPSCAPPPPLVFETDSQEPE